MVSKSPAKSAVLYVRCAPDLLEALDERVAAERERTGYYVSRSDVVRQLLGKALGLRRGKK